MTIMKRKSMLALFCATVMTFGSFATACGGEKECAHEWGEWSGDCWDGGRTRVCAKCEESEFEPLEHQFGEWYVVEPMTCVVDGEEERMCIVCEMEYETRVIECPGHIDDGDIYYNRHDHWQICEEVTCLTEMNRTAHTKDANGACTVCDWADDEYLYWNDGDTLDRLRLGFTAHSQNVSKYTVYADEIPEGYEGDARMFYKLEVNRLGVSWSAAILPELDKAVYEQLKGKDIRLVSQVYCEYPDDVEHVTYIDMLSYLFYEKLPDDASQLWPDEVVAHTDRYLERIWSGSGWQTIVWSLDDLLTYWDNAITSYEEKSSRDAHNGYAMVYPCHGNAISTASRYDMYWGDFQLVHSDGSRVLLSEVNLDVE